MRSHKTNLIVLALMSCYLVSCVNDSLQEPVSADRVTYSISDIHLEDVMEETTRSLFTGADSEINEISLFAFGTDGNILTYSEGAGSEYAGKTIEYYAGEGEAIRWLLPSSGDAFDIYAVANMGDLTGRYQTLQALLTAQEMEYCMTTTADMNSSGIPMRGILSGILGDSQIILPMKRIVAKFSLTLKDMTDSESGAVYKLVSFDVHNANGSVGIFTENDYASSGELVDLMEYASEDDIVALNAGESVSFYIPENTQTAAGRYSLSGNTDWGLTNKLLGEKYSLMNSVGVADGRLSECTYVELTFSRQLDGLRSEITKYLYLGKDCKNNFDVTRNCVTNLTLSMTGYADGPTVEYITSTIIPTAGITYEARFIATKHFCDYTDIKLKISNKSTGETYDWPYSCTIEDRTYNDDGSWNAVLVFSIDIPSDAEFSYDELLFGYIDSCVITETDADGSSDCEIDLTLTGGWWDNDVTYDVYISSNGSRIYESSSVYLGTYNVSSGSSISLLQSEWQSIVDGFTGKRYLMFVESGNNEQTYRADLTVADAKPAFEELAAGTAKALDVSDFESNGSLWICDNWWYGNIDSEMYVYASDVNYSSGKYAGAAGLNMRYAYYDPDSGNYIAAPIGTVYNYSGDEESDISQPSSVWIDLYDYYKENHGIDFFFSYSPTVSDYILRSDTYTSALSYSYYMDYEFFIPVPENEENDEMFRKLINGIGYDIYMASNEHYGLFITDSSPMDAVDGSSSKLSFSLYGYNGAGVATEITDDIEWSYSTNSLKFWDQGKGTSFDGSLTNSNYSGQTYEVTATYKGVSVSKYGYFPYIKSASVSGAPATGYFYKGLNNYSGVSLLWNTGHKTQSSNYTCTYESSNGSVLSSVDEGDNFRYRLRPNEACYAVYDEDRPGLYSPGTYYGYSSYGTLINPVQYIYKYIEVNSADGSRMRFSPRTVRTSDNMYSTTTYEVIDWSYEIIAADETGTYVYVGKTGSGSDPLYFRKEILRLHLK